MTINSWHESSQMLEAYRLSSINPFTKVETWALRTVQGMAIEGRVIDAVVDGQPRYNTNHIKVANDER